MSAVIVAMPTNALVSFLLVIRRHCNVQAKLITSSLKPRTRTRRLTPQEPVSTALERRGSQYHVIYLHTETNVA